MKKDSARQALLQSERGAPEEEGEGQGEVVRLVELVTSLSADRAIRPGPVEDHHRLMDVEALASGEELGAREAKHEAYDDFLVSMISYR